MRGVLLGIVLLAAACASSSGSSPASLPRAPDFSARQIRQPAVFIRVAGWPDLNDREREALADTYEGALVEALDEYGSPPSDLRRVVPGERFDTRMALARAREVRADHVIVIDLKVSRRDALFCTDSPRPFRAITTVWSQGVQVLRVSDGVSRVAVAPGGDLDVTELEADCANPRRSGRRDRAQMLAAATQALTQRLLGR
jgi:hypothetical protein